MRLLLAPTTWRRNQVAARRAIPSTSGISNTNRLAEHVDAHHAPPCSRDPRHRTLFAGRRASPSGEDRRVRRGADHRDPPGQPLATHRTPLATPRRNPVRKRAPSPQCLSLNLLPEHTWQAAPAAFSFGERSRRWHRRGFSAAVSRGQPRRCVLGIHESGLPEPRRPLRFRSRHRHAQRVRRQALRFRHRHRHPKRVRRQALSGPAGSAPVPAPSTTGSGTAASGTARCRGTAAWPWSTRAPPPTGRPA